MHVIDEVALDILSSTVQNMHCCKFVNCNTWKSIVQSGEFPPAVDSLLFSSWCIHPIAQHNYLHMQELCSPLSINTILQTCRWQLQSEGREKPPLNYWTNQGPRLCIYMILVMRPLESPPSVVEAEIRPSQAQRCVWVEHRWWLNWPQYAPPTRPTSLPPPPLGTAIWSVHVLYVWGFSGALTFNCVCLCIVV